MGPLNKKRLRQILAWMVAKYPPPCAVSLHFVKKIPTDYPDKVSKKLGDFAQVYPKNGKYVIELSSRFQNRAVAIESLIHEYAHCFSLTCFRAHGPEWGTVYQEIYEEFYDNDGCDDSLDY